MNRIIATAEARDALPVGTVVLAADGTIACRHYSGVGVCFGDERAFAWDVLALPLTVLYPLPTVEEIRDELAGWPIGSGYYITMVSVDEAREMGQAVLALLGGDGGE